MNRNIALDILRLSMAFMIVAIHANFLKDATLLGSYLTVNGIFRIAVPIFFIISGYYFFTVIATNKQRYWLQRIALLYCFWMLFYGYFWLPMSLLSLTSFAHLAHNIVIGYNHLWYISGTIGAAIILLLTRYASPLLLAASILITFSLGVFIQYAGNYHLYPNSVLDKLFNYDWLHRNLLFFAYPFFAIGYLLKKHAVDKRTSLTLALPLALLGMLLLLLESYLNYSHINREGDFDNYLSLLLVCPAVFIVFKKATLLGESKNIALYSAAIFFIHSFFLSLFYKFADFNETTLTLVVFIVSAGAAFFILQIQKKLKWIL